MLAVSTFASSDEKQIITVNSPSQENNSLEKSIIKKINILMVLSRF